MFGLSSRCSTLAVIMVEKEMINTLESGELRMYVYLNRVHCV